MKLANLNPVFADGKLRFDCPLHSHKIVVPIGPVAVNGVWTMEGELPNVTVHPSINAACGFHKNVVNGEFQ